MGKRKKNQFSQKPCYTYYGITTLSTALIFAASFISLSTTDSFPYSAAQCNAVFSSYTKYENATLIVYIR